MTFFNESLQCWLTEQPKACQAATVFDSFVTFVCDASMHRASMSYSATQVCADL